MYKKRLTGSGIALGSRAVLAKHEDESQSDWFGRLAERIAIRCELTPRQHAYVLRVLEGKSNREIADAWGVALNTVKFHCADTFKKCAVRSRQQLVYKTFGLEWTA